MILNIFGPSGSGKTTFIRRILQLGKTQLLFENLTNKKIVFDDNPKISISLIPLPLFKGSIKEFFDVSANASAANLCLEYSLIQQIKSSSLCGLLSP